MDLAHGGCEDYVTGRVWSPKPDAWRHARYSVNRAITIIKTKSKPHLQGGRRMKPFIHCQVGPDQQRKWMMPSLEAGWCWDRETRSGLGPMEKARVVFLKIGVQVQRRTSHGVPTHWPVSSSRSSEPISKVQTTLAETGKGYGIQQINSPSPWEPVDPAIQKIPLHLNSGPLVPKIPSLHVHFFELDVLPRRNCLRRRPWKMWNTLSHSYSCNQTSICWDAHNPPRGFTWALTFPRPGAASTRGDEEASLGRLGKKVRKDGSSHSICSLLPAHTGVSWGLFSRFSSQREDYRHLVIGKMSWKGK